MERVERGAREESSVRSSWWSKLPMDLVVTISERLDLYADYIRLRSVCKSWYSFLPKKSYHPSHNFPLLILHYHEKNCSNYHNGIFGLAKNNKLHFLRNLPDQSLHNHRCKGSSHGWLVMSRSPKQPIYLYNPFTNAKLTLPPIHVFRLQKVILSSTPPADLIVAVALHGYEGKLIFARLGEEAWTGLKPESDEFRGFKDVLFHGNKLYAVQSDLKVYVFHIGVDLHIDSSSCSILQPQPEFEDEYLKPNYRFKYPIVPYLVESSSNDVLMVVRVIERNEIFVEFMPNCCITEFKRTTIRFMVFKWEGKRWMHVKSLGEDILFVGLPSSLSISSRDFPDDCRENYIYLIDVYRAYPQTESHFDKCIFSLKDDDCIEDSLLLLEDEDSWVAEFRHPPAWFTYIQPEAPNKEGSRM
ncbi:F-box protein SKIP23-like [Macadamia integrifolia]|uniref:F-box protein SKIP23-like n=1 Tax=Macadamia integrifolia TaxID=60698 RepID=UPI001C4F2453|nr:F-box protein SKIP23-like [Macadamia integrifolia]